jgi:hypothetical protein
MKNGGRDGDVKSLWGTKEKSGNEIGQKDQPNAPSTFEFNFNENRSRRPVEIAE